MIHHPTLARPLEDHYAVGLNDSHVLAQLQEAGEQVRVALKPAEARYFAELLIKAAEELERKKGLKP